MISVFLYNHIGNVSFTVITGDISVITEDNVRSGGVLLQGSPLFQMEIFGYKLSFM